jgi:hypothetical protein
MMRKIVKEMGDSFLISAFVETGTYRGDSSAIMARNFPNLPIYTCEINPEFFEIAKRRLGDFPNVDVSPESSEKFLAKLTEKETGKTPLFFLDAHWYDYWPLRDELKIINSKFDRAILLIDDLQVPGRDDIKFAEDGSRKKDYKKPEYYDGSQVCNIDLVKNELKGSTLDIIYPNYSTKESGTKNLFGYGIIFKNLSQDFSEFIENPFIKNNFRVVRNN